MGVGNLANNLISSSVRAALISAARLDVAIRRDSAAIRSYRFGGGGVAFRGRVLFRGCHACVHVTRNHQYHRRHVLAPVAPHGGKQGTGVSRYGRGLSCDTVVRRRSIGIHVFADRNASPRVRGERAISRELCSPVSRPARYTPWPTRLRALVPRALLVFVIYSRSNVTIYFSIKRITFRHLDELGTCTVEKVFSGKHTFASHVFRTFVF